MYSKTEKIVTTGMLCALAYVLTLVGRIPIVLFLRYDTKDIVIVIGGFLFGPLTAFSVSLVVSLVQMVTTSSTGIWGFLMNLISSCAFSCTAAFFYKKKRTLYGAAAGLLCGWACMVLLMMLWNYLIAPVYMGYSRQEVAGLLVSAFLPFNLIKGGLNAALTMLFYKPVVTALRHSRLLKSRPAAGNPRVNPGAVLVSLLIVVTCILYILSFNGAF